MENPNKIDDLGVPLFLETPIYTQLWKRNLSILIFLATTFCENTYTSRQFFREFVTF